VRCRLQQLTEYDCFVKSFTYLAARLPRSEFLEPFLDEATVEPIEQAKNEFAMMIKARDLQLTDAIAFDFDEDLFMAAIHEATGKTPETENVQEKDVPLSEAEPNMYPCLLAMCGSGFSFFKVRAAYFHHRRRIDRHHVIMNSVDNRRVQNDFVICAGIRLILHGFLDYLAVGKGTKYCSQHVCVSVCLYVCSLTYLINHSSNFHQICGRISGVTAMRYVIYFRFRGLRRRNRPESNTARKLRSVR